MYCDAKPLHIRLKFVSSYGEDAYRLLAKSKLAPELIWFGETLGGLFMVVMESLPSEDFGLYIAPDQPSVTKEADKQPLTMC